MSHAPRLLIVVGSTRPSRVGGKVAEWVRDRAAEHGHFDIDYADLREIDLPLLDEPEHPSRQAYEHEHTKRWSQRVEAAAAIVFVHPEYNHGMNGALKNAIDFLNREWKGKPVGLVAYGGIAAGQRAAGQLKQVLAALDMLAIATVPIPFIRERIDDEGFHPVEQTQRSVVRMLDDLARVEPALTGLRAERA